FSWSVPRGPREVSCANCGVPSANSASKKLVSTTPVLFMVGHPSGDPIIRSSSTVDGCPSAMFVDPKPENETVGKLKAARRICFSGRARRRRYAEEGAQRGADCLRLTTDRRRQEGQRGLPGDGSIAAGSVPVEATVRRIGIERSAGTSATAGRESQAEKHCGGPPRGQTHSAGSAIKKGLKPAKRRELVREIRQAYQLNELRACGLMRITRWSNRYQSRRDPQTELRVRLRDLASTRIRYGYRRL